MDLSKIKAKSKGCCYQRINSSARGMCAVPAKSKLLRLILTCQTILEANKAAVVTSKARNYLKLAAVQLFSNKPRGYWLA